MVTFEDFINQKMNLFLKRGRGLFKKVSRYLRKPGRFVRRHTCDKLGEFSEGGDWFSDCLPTWYRPEVEYAGLVEESSIPGVVSVASEVCWVNLEASIPIAEMYYASCGGSLFRVGFVGCS